MATDQVQSQTSAPGSAPPQPGSNPVSAPPPAATQTPAWMLAPDGTVRQVAPAQHDAALAAGGKPVIRMQAPDKSLRWVPVEQAEQAVRAGGQPAEPAAGTTVAATATGSATTPASQPVTGSGAAIGSTDSADSSAPSATEPSWRDKVLSYLTAPRQSLAAADDKRTAKDFGLPADTSPRLVEAAKMADRLLHSESPVSYSARRALGGAAGIILHPVEAAKGAISQAADSELPASGVPLPGNLQEKIVSKLTSPEDAAAMRENHEKFIAQGTELMHNLHHDPVGTLSELAGQVALTHGAGEVLSALKGKIGDTVVPAVKTQLKISPADTQAMVEKTLNANQAATDRAAATNKKNLEDHSAKIDLIRKNNAAAEADAAAKTAAAKSQATQDFQDAQQAAGDATQAESDRGQLARQEITLRNRIADRVQAVRAAAKASVDQQFGKIREMVGPREAPLAPLVDAVSSAENEFQGSKEKVGVFQDIIRRAKEGSENQAADQLRADVMTSQGMKGLDYNKLPEARKMLVDKLVKDISEKSGIAEEDAEPTSIDFGHLRGYSSELGQALRSNLDGDVKRAVYKVKAQVDAMAEKLANDAGAGSKLKRAKSDYSTFKDTFDEPSGGSSSGSPVAQSIQAEDAFHATQPFLDKDQFVANRARQMLVGDKFSGPHYDPNAGKLIDQLRDIKRKQATLPKPAATATALAAAPTETAPVEPVPIQPKLKPEPPAPKTVEPQISQITPDSLAQHNLQRAQTWIRNAKVLTPGQLGSLVSGTLSLTAGLAGWLTHSINPAVLSVADAIGGSALLHAMGPKVLATLLDSPKIIDKLAKPSLADFKEVMKLPAEQRPGVEAAMRELAKQAEAAGKLQKPSPWLAAFDTFLAANPEARHAAEQQQQVESNQSKKDLADDLAKREQEVNSPGFGATGAEETK